MQLLVCELKVPHLEVVQARIQGSQLVGGHLLASRGSSDSGSNTRLKLKHQTHTQTPDSSLKTRLKLKHQTFWTVQTTDSMHLDSDIPSLDTQERQT